MNIWYFYLGMAVCFLAVSVFAYALMATMVDLYEKHRLLYQASGGTSQGVLNLFFASQEKSASFSVLGALVGGVLLIKAGVAGILFGAMLGYLLPLILTRSRARKRHRKLEEQFVGSLDIMAGALRAGLTIPQALESTQKAVDYPLSEEYSLMVRQLKIGLTLGDALSSLSGRIPSPDVRLAATSIAISSRTGANLAEALQVLTSTLKKRSAVKSKIHSATFMGKAQGILVGGMPFALAGMLYLISPNSIGPLFTTNAGHLILAVVIITQTIAYIAIKRITSIDI